MRMITFEIVVGIILLFDMILIGALVLKIHSNNVTVELQHDNINKLIKDSSNLINKLISLHTELVNLKNEVYSNMHENENKLDIKTDKNQDMLLKQQLEECHKRFDEELEKMKNKACKENNENVNRLIKSLEKIKQNSIDKIEFNDTNTSVGKDTELNIDKLDEIINKDINDAFNIDINKNSGDDSLTIVPELNKDNELDNDNLEKGRSKRCVRISLKGIFQKEISVYIPDDINKGEELDFAVNITESRFKVGDIEFIEDDLREVLMKAEYDSQYLDWKKIDNCITLINN